MNLKQKNLLMKESVEVLKAYAGSENTDPVRFQEVLESAYEALKNFLAYTQKN